MAIANYLTMNESVFNLEGRKPIKQKAKMLTMMIALKKTIHVEITCFLYV